MANVGELYESASSYLCGAISKFRTGSSGTRRDVWFVSEVIYELCVKQLIGLVHAVDFPAALSSAESDALGFLSRGKRPSISRSWEPRDQVESEHTEDQVFLGYEHLCGRRL